MKKEYDFSSAKKNPYASNLKKQVIIRPDESAVEDFKKSAEKNGISYRNLINPYPVDCEKNRCKIGIKFA